jgi:hypothetical protein
VLKNQKLIVCAPWNTILFVVAIRKLTVMPALPNAPESQNIRLENVLNNVKHIDQTSLFRILLIKYLQK